MNSHALPVPGLLWGDYPQRRPARLRLTQRANLRLRCWLDGGRDAARGAAHALDRYAALLPAVPFSPSAHGADRRWLAGLRAHQRLLATQPFAAALAAEQARLRHLGMTPASAMTSLACVALAAERHLGLAAFDTQLLAARAVLDNRLAEMATGEGKTLAVALAACAAALSGTPVHVVTANDYLVQRDARFIAPLCAALGLSVGQVLGADAPAARAVAYQCAITYVTAKELVFDYLRDSLATTLQPLGQSDDSLPLPLPRLLRGLCMAIVDEADALLIDEACVPLILAGPAPEDRAAADAAQGLALAAGLKPGRDYTLDAGNLRATLTDAGRAHLAQAAAHLEAVWQLPQHRDHVVGQALVAQQVLQRDRHYLVAEDKVHIIDPATGRVAPGRSWSQGLHQMVELKEGCPFTAATVTLAQITYQRFFTRYHRLGGLSGTLAEARGELMQTYGLSVQRIALRRPCLRRRARTRLFAHSRQLWPAMAAQVARLQALGRPVMVVADAVNQAQAASAALQAEGLAHRVLHAAQDAEEASVVAAAGEKGALTVSTQMAGRGTDIALGQGVAARGGLHVLAAQLNASPRGDRQVAGRAARQGEPGSTERWLALDMPLLAEALAPWACQALAPWCQHLPGWAVQALAAWAQARASRAQREQRRRVAEHDERLAQQLAFCSPPMARA